MHTPALRLKLWLCLWIAALLALGGLGAARAAENHTGAWGLISQMGSQNPYDSIWLVTGDPADPFVHKNLIYVNMDMQYNFPSYGQWESATWRPASSFPTQRFPASLLGTDEYTNPIEGRYIQLRNLTLDRADLDAQNVEFRFIPVSVPAGDTALTLNNGSMTALNAPRFTPAANLTLTASGDSMLSGWERGQVFSQTQLNVTPGGQLRLFRLGDRHGTLPTDSWYFSETGNVATIDGGTLHLDESFVTFGKSVVAPGEALGKMTFQNNALLNITGERGSLKSGDLFFLDSRLNLGSTNQLQATGTTTFNGASLTTDENSQFSTEGLAVLGANTLTLGKETRTGHFIATTGAMTLHPGALLTLNGEGSLAATFALNYLYPATGRIVINDNAKLINAGGHFDIRPSAPITINRTSDNVFGFLDIRDGGELELKASASERGEVTNHGGIGASTDGVIQTLGPVIIQGGSEGYINMASGGTLTIGNPGAPLTATESLTTDNIVYLENFSTLELTLEPKSGKNSQLRLGSSLSIEHLADLHLTLVNDQALPNGAKFTLIGYGALTGGGRFNGYPDGSTFVLGLNHYRINYRDTADTGYNGAITLTVANPNPLPPNPLPVTVTVTGNGKVTIAPAGIDCGSDCTESFAPDTVVTLTAIPPGGYLFIGWQGACQGGLPVCTITMSAARTVQAQFLRRQNPIWKRVRQHSPLP